MATKKAKQATDATMRNVRAGAKRDAKLTATTGELQQQLGYIMAMSLVAVLERIMKLNARVSTLERATSHALTAAYPLPRAAVASVKSKRKR